MSSLTVKELRSICKAMGIRGYSRLRKAELIRLLEQKQEVQQQLIIEDTKESNVEDSTEECPICMCEMSNKKTTSCGHSFCKSCITKWCENNNECPLCRKDIKNEIIKNLDTNLDRTYFINLERETLQEVYNQLTAYISTNEFWNLAPSRSSYILDKLNIVRNLLRS